MNIFKAITNKSGKTRKTSYCMGNKYISQAKKTKTGVKLSYTKAKPSGKNK